MSKPKDRCNIYIKSTGNNSDTGNSLRAIFVNVGGMMTHVALVFTFGIRLKKHLNFIANNVWTSHVNVTKK